MSVDRYVDQSYGNYVAASAKFAVVPVEKKLYRDLLFSAASALKDVLDTQQGDHPYVIVAIGDLYMKAKKIGENLDVSFMDRETFNLTTRFKENQK
jgi:hypothetical protein